MKRNFTLVLLLCAMACGAYAQAVDTTVCAVLKNPQSFDGKTVRIKGTVVEAFDEFAITDGDCGGAYVSAIWLAYPQGGKYKSGPVAMVELQPAHNFAGKAAAASRPAVTVTRDKTFKQFDSLLAQTHEESGAVCLGCPRNQVQATLVGRLDGVADADVQRDGQGKIVGLGGFGNLNAYPARLVIESVTDVSSKDIDYSASDTMIKKAQAGTTAPPAQPQAYFDPIESARKLAAAMQPSTITTQIQADAAQLPKPKEQNGVEIGYGAMNEIAAGEGAPASVDSPDGVIYKCTLNKDRLSDQAIQMALMHVMQHVEDVRAPRPGNENAPLYILEGNAWAVTATIAIVEGEKFVVLPGGYMLWDSTWPDSDKVSDIQAGMNDFLTKEQMLTK